MKKTFIITLNSKLRKWSVAALIFFTIAVLLPACGSDTGDSLTLKLAPGHDTASEGPATGFDTEDALVLRCASVSQNGSELVIITSKSKSMKAESLAFIKPLASGDAQNVMIAIVPVTGKEYEYDMSRAQTYAVTPASAVQALETYGIPFLDWQTGACSTSEQFPCCE